MKTVAVVLATEPQHGGGHQYAKLVAESLKELTEEGFEVIGFCLNEYWIDWCNKNRIVCYRLKWKSAFPWINLKFPVLSRLFGMHMTDVGKLIIKNSVDVLFITSQLMSIANWHTKIIIPVHDLMHRYEPDFPEVKAQYKIREDILQCQAKYAYCVLTDSKLGCKQFTESYLLNCRKEPSVISLPFAVPEHIGQGREEYIEVPSKFVFYPAQFWKHKNHINLLRAVKLVKETVPDVHLVLVGSEKNSQEEIEEYIQFNDLANNVTIMGFVTDENMTYLYKHAVGMIMPSFFGPTNIPPLEAMALGCPVAVSNKYAMPEQVGNAGLLFDPCSPHEIAYCIKRLWEDDELRKKMIIMGYKKIQSWTRDDFKEAIKDIVKSCLS